MNLGTTKEDIELAERELTVAFPEVLKAVWFISNGLELAGEWRLYPVFDSANPRKTANHIVYENTKGRWGYMPAEFLSIAENGTGNQLVLKNEQGILKPEIYVWNHETNRIEKWIRTLEDVLKAAKERIEKIENEISKDGMRRT